MSEVGSMETGKADDNLEEKMCWCGLMPSLCLHPQKSPDKWDALRKAATDAQTLADDYDWPRNEMLTLPPFYVSRVFLAKANPAAILELLSELSELREEFNWLKYGIRKPSELRGMERGIMKTSQSADFPEAIGILTEMVNDTAFDELCQGIGEEPKWLKKARTLLEAAPPDCCKGAAPAHECYINCGGTKPNPVRGMERGGEGNALIGATKAMCLFCADKAHTIWDGKMHPYDDHDVTPAPIKIEEQYVSNCGVMEGWVHKLSYGGFIECAAGPIHDLLATRLIPTSTRLHKLPHWMPRREIGDEREDL